MKKLLIATAVSSLFAVSAIAGEASGSIDIESSVTNAPCVVTIAGATSAITNVVLDSVSLDQFNAGIAGPIGGAKSFTLKATGAACDDAELTLTPAIATTTPGVFEAVNSTDTGAKNLQLLLNYVDGSTATAVNFATAFTGIPTVAVGTVPAEANYSFDVYNYFDGTTANLPSVGVHRTTLGYTVVNQ